MRIPVFHGSRDDASDPPSRLRTLTDIGLILLLVAAMVAIRAQAPSHTYNYAQFWQIRASIDHLNGGSLLLAKIDSLGTPARKGPLYAWLLTATMRLTGANNDFIYRIPTILAAVALAILIYFLGRRWYGRWAGLIAACLWTTCLHMSKLMYLATTDMLLAWWIGLSVFCADRLTFHPASRRRWLWTIGLWAAMICAALTKGWGIVNLAIIGGWLAHAMFMKKSPEGTPHATAEAFVKAAKDNDMAAVRSLCISSAADKAERAAGRIHALSPNLYSFSFKAMQADHPRRGLMATFSGQVLGIEMIKEGDQWKIVEISIAG
jgi:hypothetical protein